MMTIFIVGIVVVAVALLTGFYYCGSDETEILIILPNPSVEGFFVIDPEKFRPYLRQDYDWAVKNVPFIDLDLKNYDQNGATRNEDGEDDVGNREKYTAKKRRRNEEDTNDIVTAYYYRWRSYKKHVVYVDGDYVKVPSHPNDRNDIEISDDRRKYTNTTNTKYVGYVVTEFLPNVPWAGKYNTIPAAAGHHIMEGRWIHDDTILNDYITFWIYNPNSNPSSYTNWIGHAAYQRYLLNGNWDFIESLSDGLVDLFRNEYVPKYLRNVTTSSTATQNCWYQNDGYDAMEVSISGNGCRPTIASVMYGEAEAIVWLAQTTQQAEIENEFRQWMELSRSIILDLHWNPRINSFAVIPLEDEHAYKIGEGDNGRLSEGDRSDQSFKEGCDLASVRIPNKPVNARELLAFMPWYYDTLVPTAHRHRNHKDYSSMWRQLFDDEGGYAATYGLRTAEYRHQCYNYSWDHGDCWNGPSWPYETSRVLTSLANILNRDNINSRKKNTDDTSAYNRIDHGSYNSFGMTKNDYWELLLQYAKQHTRTYAVNDTANPIGSGHIFENLHPDLGYWNNRQIMYGKNDPNQDMGDDYNHSTFCDLILSGLFGIRPQPNGIIHINPLVPSSVKQFAVDHVRIQGDTILSLTWSSDSNNSVRSEQSSTGYPAGLTVRLNGHIVAHRSDIGLLKIKLSKK